MQNVFFVLSVKLFIRLKKYKMPTYKKSSKCNCSKGNKDQTNFRSNTSTDFENGCLFCKKVKNRKILIENNFSFAILDSYPVSKGHTLVIPKRHVADYFEMTEIEQNAVHDLLGFCRKQLLDTDPSIKGFNVGVNCGKVAGQTIFHCHIHLIPRRPGDTDHPEGGVRGVIPNKMSYRRDFR